MPSKKQTTPTQTPAQVNARLATTIMQQTRFARGVGTYQRCLYVERDGLWHRTGWEAVCAAVVKLERGVDWTRARRVAAVVKRIRHRVPPLPPDARLADPE